MFAGLGASDFVVVIFGIIGVAMLFSYFQSKKKVEESQSWPAVQGYITKTHIRRETEKDNDGSRITKYYPEVLYTYEFLGKEYTGDKISFGGKTKYSYEQKAENFLVQYPVGQGIKIYYDPNNPEDAVLERKALGKVILIIGVIFTLIAIGALLVRGGAALMSLMGQ